MREDLSDKIQTSNCTHPINGIIHYPVIVLGKMGTVPVKWDLDFEFEISVYRRDEQTKHGGCEILVDTRSLSDGFLNSM